jgi:hypothetical protein
MTSPEHDAVAGCSTVADELLAAQLGEALVCSTVAEELLEVAEPGHVCSTVVDELIDGQLQREGR